MKIKVTDINENKTIGYLSTKDFMQYVKDNFSISSQKFLTDYINKFNESKTKLNEPERVSIVLK